MELSSRYGTSNGNLHHAPILTGKCWCLAQASSHVPTALALAGRGALAEINDRNQRDFWEIAARNQQTV